MINPNELRRGNIIADHHGDQVAVIAIADKELSLQFEDMIMTGIGPDQCEPIPLTPEWLEKLGYKYYPDEKKYYKSPHNLPPIYCWRMGDYGMEGLPLSAKSFQFVHQLQNLYFALTGEELIINHEHLQSTS